MIESARRHHTAGRFIWARIRRMYSAFIVLQMLIFSIGYATHAKGLGDPVDFVERFIFDGLILPGVLPIDPIQTVAWTLSFEAAFYLLAASMRRRPEWLIAIVVLSTVFDGGIRLLSLRWGSLAVRADRASEISWVVAGRVVRRHQLQLLFVASNRAAREAKNGVRLSVGLAWRELCWHRNRRLVQLEMDRGARSTVDGASEGPR
jgi:peptidoglycan/LPS O-acetylase OafA/YrhL